MSEIVIKLERPRVEELFAPFSESIGDDFPSYRNHVYRAITYAMHFLGGCPEHERFVETVFVYHDIGIWTDRTMAYLGPSEALALADNQKYGWDLNPDALRGAIHWHHKIFAYKGPHQELIEACRKADWVDATQGMIRKGLPRAAVRKVEATFPNLGFHRALLRLTKEVGGSTLAGGFAALRDILKL